MLCALIRVDLKLKAVIRLLILLFINCIVEEKVFQMDPESFKAVFGLTTPVVKDYVQQYLLRHGNHQNYRFSATTEILIFLLHFRHYPVDALLALFFNTNRITIRNVRLRCLRFFYSICKDKLAMQTREHHTTLFFGDYISFILDGSEQPVHSSKDAIHDFNFYSVKKKRHTINTLVIISAKDRRILHISPSFPGSINDSDIVKQTKQEWWNQLESHEYGLGDSGFNGMMENFHILTPPSNRKMKKQFSSLRVHVENTIRSLKEWRACKFELREQLNNQELLELHHRYWVISAVFHNEHKNYEL